MQDPKLVQTLYTPEFQPISMIQCDCPEETIRFIKGLFSRVPTDYWIEFRPLPYDRHKRSWMWTGEVQSRRWLPDFGENVNAYMGVLPRDRCGVGKKKNVLIGQVVWVDLDQGQQREWHLPPSIIVQSSPGKYQVYWLLVHPTYNLAEIEDANRRLVDYYGGDKACWGRGTILRLPGYPNLKYPEKPLAHLIECRPDVVYTLEDLLADIPEVADPKAKKHKGASVGGRVYRSGTKKFDLPPPLPVMGPPPTPIDVPLPTPVDEPPPTLVFGPPPTPERIAVWVELWEGLRITLLPGDNHYLCPFHTETEPSMHIHRERIEFHCFGECPSGEGGGLVALRNIIYGEYSDCDQEPFYENEGFGDYGPPRNRGKKKQRGRDLPEVIYSLRCSCSKADVNTASALGGSFQYRKHNRGCQYKWAAGKFFNLSHYAHVVGGLAIYERMAEGKWLTWYKKAKKDDDRLRWNILHRIRVGKEFLLLGPAKCQVTDSPSTVPDLDPLTEAELAEILVEAAAHGLTGRMIETIGRVTPQTLVSKGERVNKGDNTSCLLSAKSRFLQINAAEIEESEDLLSHIGFGFGAFEEKIWAELKSEFRNWMIAKAYSAWVKLAQMETMEEAAVALDAFWDGFKSRKEQEADYRRQLLGIDKLWPKPPFALPKELADKSIELREKHHPRLWPELFRVGANFALERFTPASERVAEILDAIPADERTSAMRNPPPNLKAALEAREDAADDLAQKISQLYVDLDRCGSLEEQVNHLSWYLDG